MDALVGLGRPAIDTKYEYNLTFDQLAGRLNDGVIRKKLHLIAKWPGVVLNIRHCQPQHTASYETLDLRMVFLLGALPGGIRRELLKAHLIRHRELHQVSRLVVQGTLQGDSLKLLFALLLKQEQRSTFQCTFNSIPLGERGDGSLSLSVLWRSQVSTLMMWRLHEHTRRWTADS